MGPLARALRFLWTMSDAGAGEAVPIPAGTILRTPALPETWSVNAVRLERPAPGVTLEAAEELAATHVGVPYRHVLVEDEPTALRLLAAAEKAERWSTECELVMALDRVPDEPPRAAVREGTLDEVLALTRAWLAEEGLAPDAVEQVTRLSELEHGLLPERLFVADHDGRPAVMATARLGAGIAQVEDVYALPQARRHGLGRAVTVAAARAAADAVGLTGGADAPGAAGADRPLVIVVADDRGWPKELYARLGFVPLGRRAELHRAAA